VGVCPKLHKLPEKEGLHIANKLTTRHIAYYRHKMKVKLASQVISRSVADAIEKRDEDDSADFKDSSKTVEFLRIFNDLFDVCNSKTMLQVEWKKPINNEN